MLDTSEEMQLCTSQENIMPSELKSSKFRWVVAFALVVQNMLNASLWISLSPIANLAVIYYKTSYFIINWISLIFPLCTILLGLPAAFAVDCLGLRFVLVASTLLHCICVVLRILSSCTIQFSVAMRLFLLVLAQTFASFAQPLCMFAPAKLAFMWFPDTQRTTANNIAAIANPLGVMLGSALAPLAVNRADDIPTLHWILFWLNGFVTFVTLPSFYRNAPVHPPSVASAAIRLYLQRFRQLHPTNFIRQHVRNFCSNLLIVVTDPGFAALTVGFSCGLAYFTTVSSLFQQILCSRGYSNSFAGWCGSVMIFSGAVCSFVVALLVDKTKAILATLKVCFCMAVLGAVGLSIAIAFGNLHGMIIFFVIWFGGFGFSNYCLSLEMAAEATYPVPEAITSGIMVIVGQVLSVILILVMQATATNLQHPEFSVCGSDIEAKDYTLPNLVIVCLVAVWSVVQLFMLRLPYKRRMVEEMFCLPPHTEFSIESASPLQSSSQILGCEVESPVI